MTELKSSNIESAEWVEGVGLTITFRSGATYTYPSADEQTYQDLLTSESPGSYFARNIKNRFNFTKDD